MSGSAARTYWESQAAIFDDEPDHGLRRRDTRDAWRSLLLEHLPAAPADVADLGCGTGTLAVLLAQEGFRVRGVDLADAMVAAATEKAAEARVTATFQQGDASAPPYEPASCDVVLSRHVLWAMPAPSAALRNWVRLLRPGGRLVLVEGRWSTGAGLSASACERLLRAHRTSVVVRELSDSRYWGRDIDDERYLAVSIR
jgi:ubiquinone/menaquinone biosynthesis C-methylase UbiE